MDQQLSSAPATSAAEVSTFKADFELHKRRIAAQFEMATGTPLGAALDHVQYGPQAGLDLATALIALNKEHELGISYGPYVIRSESEQGYWCNDFGWVNDPLAATGVHWQYPLNSMVSDAQYVAFGDAKPFPLD